MPASTDTYPRWMSIKDAKKYSPLGETLLLRLLDAGKIKGGRVVDDKRKTRFIDRLSLDRYMESMCETSTVEKEALAICEELGI